MILDEKTVQLIAKTAIDEYNKQREKAEKRARDNRLHNIRLLLQNYKKLETYVKRAKGETEEPDVTVEELMKSDDVIKSIRQSTARTKLMFEYVEATLNNFKALSLTDSEHTLYNIIKLKYIDGLKIEEVCERTGYSRRHVFRLIDDACNVLSVLMFGVDAINFK
ncbi:hypothetical protein [Macrococcus capreoli]|uniref:hypothetical protein n=1 Tax=Macrococcus capreoli TaxID=2982690 RepID=UPI003EE4432C